VREDELSGVAGGIRKCKEYLSGATACIIMGDAIMDVDLGKLYEKHLEAVKTHNCKASMAVMQIADTSQFGVVVTDDNNRITKFQEKPKAEDALSDWANTGIYFFEPEVLEMIPPASEAAFYDVAKDLFPKMLNNDVFMQAIAVPAETYWADIGTPQQYITTMQDIVAGKVKLDSIKENLIETETIDSTAKLIADNEIGVNCVIEKDVTLKNCVLWNNVRVKAGAFLENCIIADNVVIPSNANLNNELIIEKALANK
jgi:NDP-sugar pyrophosphorylase family protein